MNYTGSQDYVYISLIEETIEQIFKSESEEFQEKVNKAYFVICEGAYGHTTSIKVSEIVPKEKIGSKETCNHEVDVIILNFEVMKDKSEDFKRYIIAHEIAHFNLGHKGFIKDDGGEGERKADELAKKWGFRKGEN